MEALFKKSVLNRIEKRRENQKLDPSRHRVSEVMNHMQFQYLFQRPLTIAIPPQGISSRQNLPTTERWIKETDIDDPASFVEQVCSPFTCLLHICICVLPQQPLSCSQDELRQSSEATSFNALMLLLLPQTIIDANSIQKK